MKRTVAIVSSALAALAIIHCGAGSIGDDALQGDGIGSIGQPLTSGQRQAKVNERYLENTWLGGITENGYIDFTSPPGGRTMYEGGSIWIGDEVGSAQLVYGTILSKYLAVGAQASFLRFPTTDEWDTPDYDGRYNHFQGGSIYYKWGASEAHEVHGWIRDVWIRLGWERSKLGWPIGDEYAHGSGSASKFEYGGIYYNPGSDLENATHPVLYTVADNSRLDSDAPTLDTKMLPNAFGWWLQAWGRNWTPGATINIRMIGPTQGYYLGQGTVRSDGTFNIDQTSAPGDPYVERSHCVLVNDVATFQAVEGGSKQAVVGHFLSDCTNHEDP